MPSDYKSSDLLLYVLSNKGKLTWKEFKSTYDFFAKVDENSDHQFRRSNLLRIFQALAHCDVDFADGKGSIYLAAPVLARLPWRGLPTAVLCGARSASTVESLEEICGRLNLATEKIEPEIQSNGDSLTPTRVAITADTVDQLQLLANTSGFKFNVTPSAWRVIALCSSLQAYEQTLVWTTKSDLSWKRVVFDPTICQFTAEHYRAGLKLVRYHNPQRRNEYINLVWNGEKSAAVDLDFGRYLTLKATGKNVLFFDRRRHLLAVPIGAPLPPLIARAVTLCSGWAPQVMQPHTTDYDLVTYKMVPASIAEVVAEKLGQHLTDINIV